jgi:hypothetical protein
MRILQFVVYGFMGAVLAGGWAFFYLQSGADDLASVDAARSAANALRAVDSRWNDQLAAARASGSRFQPAPHALAYAELEVRGFRVYYPGIGRALIGVKNAFDEKAGAMRRVAKGEPLLEQAWLAPTGPRLDTLSRVLDRAFDDALAWAEVYRTWLLYYTVFLLTVMLYALHQIRKARAPAAR